MRFASLVVTLGCASVASAQITFPVQVVDNGFGNTISLSQTGLPTSATGSITGGNANFGSANSCDTDVMYGHYGLWRVAGDPQNSAFYDSGIAGDQGGITQSSTGPDQALIHWPDVDNRGIISAELEMVAQICGVNCGKVYVRWMVCNETSSPIDVEFYAYVDYDFFGAGNDQTETGSNSIRAIVTDAACPGEGLEVYAGGSSAWEVGSFPSVANNLTANPFPGLANASLPFGPADFTAAYCYQATLPPGSWLTVEYWLSVNCLFCANPSAKFNYGPAFGSAIGTLDTPAVGCPVSIDVIAPPGVPGPATVLFGTAQALVPLPFGCPQTLLVNPLTSFPVPLGPGGAGKFVIQTPLNPVWCGVSVYFQMWIPDPFLPCPIPLSHSDGLCLTFGCP